MSPEVTPSLATLLEAASSGKLPSAPPYDMGKTQHKSLASTGHLVERFLAACDILRVRLQQKRVPELLPYFNGFDLTASPALTGEGLFVCPLHLNDSTLKLQPLLLPDQQASRVISAWQRVQLDAPKALPHPLEIPKGANAPLWPALLHLRPLHPFWEQQLRHSHVETLLDRVPHAWMLDPSPLPPGAVIPKLENASWQDLTPDRHFTIEGTTPEHDTIPLDPTHTAEEWNKLIHEALQSFGKNPQVLSETVTHPEAILLGIYQRQNKRVDLIGGIALHRNESAAWQFSRW